MNFMYDSMMDRIRGVLDDGDETAIRCKTPEQACDAVHFLMDAGFELPAYVMKDYGENATQDEAIMRVLAEYPMPTIDTEGGCTEINFWLMVDHEVIFEDFLERVGFEPTSPVSDVTLDDIL